jgi:type I restriction enzyme M protein
VTNPPFGGEEEAGIQLNFPEATRTSETALLFLQFIMRSLKPKGRCAVVVPNGTLFGDGVAAKVKAKMLTDSTCTRSYAVTASSRRTRHSHESPLRSHRPTTDIWYCAAHARWRKNYSKTAAAIRGVCRGHGGTNARE